MPVNLIADIWHARYRRFYTPIAAIGENRNRCTGHTWRFSPIAAIGENRQVCRRLKEEEEEEEEEDDLDFAMCERSHMADYDYLLHREVPAALRISFLRMLHFCRK